MLNRDEIPLTLELPAEQALAWLNAKQRTNFKLTGLAEPIVERNTSEFSPFILHLVLCEGGICMRKDIEVFQKGSDRSFRVREDGDSEIPSLLDPPRGHRTDWIDDQLKKHVSFCCYIIVAGGDLLAASSYEAILIQV